MDYDYKFLKKVSDYIEANNMIKKGDNIIVGVSGGGDSVCLFLILKELSLKVGFNLFAVHVNHGIRGITATRDELFSKALCDREGVSCEVYHLDVVEKARVEKLTIEEAGRKARYEVFEKESKEHNNAKIAVAHHINDQAETVLFNMIRGSGLKGMGGILPVRDNIIRPLLCVTKEEILKYLNEKGEAYCTDETNEDDLYSRNSIRNNVINTLEKIQPESVTHIANTAAELREAQEFIEDVAQNLFNENVTKSEEGYFINVKSLKNEKPIILRYIIIFTMQQLIEEWKDITRIHINDVLSLKEKGRGKEIHLPKGLIAKRVTDGILIYKEESI